MAGKLARDFVGAERHEGVLCAVTRDGERVRLTTITLRAEVVRIAFRVLGSGQWAKIPTNVIWERVRDKIDGVPETLPVDEVDEDDVTDDTDTDDDTAEVSGETDDVLAKVRELLGGSIDYAKVRKIVVDEVAKVVARPTQVVVNDVPKVTVDGLVHKRFPEVLPWIHAGVPVFLTGPAGVGKTTLAETIAKAIDARRIFVIQADALPQRHEVFGFLSPVSGDYVTGAVYDLYKNGGIFLIDEFDTGHTSLGTNLNLLLAQGYYDFPNGEHVVRHADFRVVVTGNTYGQGGSVEFAGTNRINGATLDRFVKVEIDVDEQLERAIVTNICSVRGPSVHDVITKIRANALRHGLRVFVTPRASIHVTQGVVAGLTVKQAVTAKLLTGLPSDQQVKLLEGVTL
jgi:energy-coupling factor transporter ATP-binding protein EcfA2